MVVSPYVGIARKQDSGSNGCISNYTVITWLRTGFIAPTCHFQALLWPTRMSISPKNSTKVINRQPGKTQFSSSFQVSTTNKVAKKEVDKV